MSEQAFIYTTYIRSTPEKVWTAITNPEFARQYWVHGNVSDWKPGSGWKHVSADGSVKVEGKVIESVPPKRLVLTWAEPGNLSDDSRVTFEIEGLADMVCLRVLHGDFKPGSTMKQRVSTGWPLVLSGLKSFLETGKAIDIWAWKKTDCSKSA